MGNKLPEWRVESERSETGGYAVFVIVDEYGEYADHTRVYNSMKDAEEECCRLHQADLDNYDGPPDDPDAWSGGFAESH